MAVLGSRFCVRAFSSCGKRGPLFIAACGPLTTAASLVVDHRLQIRRLSNCVSRAQLLCGMWDLPRPGLEPMSPALTDRLSTTAPPGKPCSFISFVVKSEKYTCWLPSILTLQMSCSVNHLCSSWPFRSTLLPFKSCCYYCNYTHFVSDCSVLPLDLYYFRILSSTLHSSKAVW